jgi:hypothetical protein
LAKRNVNEVKQFSFKPRRPMPRGWYSAVDGLFHDGPEGELTWGSRGYAPDDTPDLEGKGKGLNEDDRITLWKLCGALKRAWEYPALTRRLGNNPMEYLTHATHLGPERVAAFLIMTGPNPKAEVAPLLNGDGKILPLAQAVGMDLDEVMRVGPDVVGARLALYLIHILHERWIDTSIECK